MDTTTATQRVTLILLERSSDSLPWLEQQGSSNAHSDDVGGSTDVIVLSQLDSEGPAEFATRAAARLARVDRRVLIERAVLACSARADDTSLSARARMAQVLLAVMGSASSAELTLAGPWRTPDALRLQLLALAGTLLDELRSPNVAVSVKLGVAPSREAAGSWAPHVMARVA